MNLCLIFLQIYLDFYEPSIKENFVSVFSNYINKYQKQSEELFNSCRGENSIIVDEI